MNENFNGYLHDSSDKNTIQFKTIIEAHTDSRTLWNNSLAPLRSAVQRLDTTGIKDVLILK